MLICPPFVAMSMQLLAETDQKRSDGYLIGYTPPASGGSNILAHQGTYNPHPGAVYPAQAESFAQPGEGEGTKPSGLPHTLDQGFVQTGQIIGQPYTTVTHQGQPSTSNQYGQQPMYQQPMYQQQSTPPMQHQLPPSITVQYGQQPMYGQQSAPTMQLYGQPNGATGDLK